MACYPQELLEKISLAADAKKGENITILNLTDISMIADYFIIISGQNNRHVRSIVEGIKEATLEINRKPDRIEGEKESHWVLLDYGEIVVHVFKQDIRDYYQIENLWADAQSIEKVF